MDAGQDADMSRVADTGPAGSVGLVAMTLLLAFVPVSSCGGKITDTVELDGGATATVDGAEAAGADPVVACPASASGVTTGAPCPVDYVNCDYPCGILTDGSGLTSRCWRGHWIDVEVIECP